MKLEALPNGRYRIRQQYKGQKISINFDHKPDQKEINIALANKMAYVVDKMPEKGTLDDYATKYLAKKKKADLSPTTLSGYESIKKNTPLWFKRLDIQKVTSDDVQKCVDEYYDTHSSKSTRSLYSFWKCVLVEYSPYLNYAIKLPKKEKKSVYEPSTKDVKAILEYAKGTRYELPLKMASIGLRRGEFCAITKDDLNEDNVLTINKDMIVSDTKQIIKNTPKTDASNRRILIPEDIADMLREQEQVFDGNMHTINEYLHKAQKALDIPSFNLHILRHFAAAFLLKNGFNSIQIEDYMGWEHGSTVMQKVYAYNLDPEESQKTIACIFSNL